MKKKAERELILRCYDEGFRAFHKGKKFHPPDNMVLRRAYSLGFEDALNSTATDPDDVVDQCLDQ
ncbi:MAG: hypothetical protein E6Q97_10990 [Desulfurellales bacterium]|nr:MAG: hypothetical protein E6Q97_10990 [Desulfurellales bacterium]